MSVELNKDLFQKRCLEVFSFLIEENAFKKPEIEDFHEKRIISFYKGEIAIEIIFDEKDMDISVKLALLRNGKKQDGYRLNSEGKLIRDYLTKLLMDRGIRNFNIQKGKKESFDCESILLWYKRLIQENGDLILDGKDHLFV